MKHICVTIIALIGALTAMGQQLTNLPTIYINTEGGQEIYSKEEYVPCAVTISTDVEEDAIVDRAAGIRGRGNSTWNMDKKPYRIKFDKKINLFNLPAKAKSWVLLANYADKSLMRNAVAFEISRFVGFDFSPSTVFADVVLNGTYIGNYMITDQMEVNPGRVDIDEMTSEDIDGDNLTGGYFLEIDGFGYAEPVHFTTPKGMTITVKSPKDDVIQPAQLNYITKYIRDLEALLFSSKFDDPDDGFRKMVDVPSFVNWYICCELTGNSDSFWSTYVYKKRGDDHLYFGPLWDFDIAFNNDNRLGDAVNKLMRENAHDPKTWIQRMWQAQWFRQAVYDRWCELIDAGIEQHIIDYINQTAVYLNASQQLNYNVWRVLNHRVYLEQFLFPTYDQYVQYLRGYIAERIAFLDASFRASGATSVIDDIADGCNYYVMHYVGLYATPEADNFYIENYDSERQQLTFVNAGSPGVWNIRTPDGRYVASRTNDKYCTYLNDGSDTRARFSVEPSRYEGHALIRNVYTGKCLGIEHTAHYSRISTNKDGSSTDHAWKILPVDPSGGVSSVNASSTLIYDRQSGNLVCDQPTNIAVYTSTGVCVFNCDGVSSLSVASLTPGLYIARTPSATIKFVK